MTFRNTPSPAPADPVEMEFHIGNQVVEVTMIKSPLSDLVAFDFDSVESASTFTEWASSRISKTSLPPDYFSEQLREALATSSEDLTQFRIIYTGNAFAEIMNHMKQVTPPHRNSEEKAEGMGTLQHFAEMGFPPITKILHAETKKTLHSPIAIRHTPPKDILPDLLLSPLQNFREDKHPQIGSLSDEDLADSLKDQINALQVLVIETAHRFAQNTTKRTLIEERLGPIPDSVKEMINETVNTVKRSQSYQQQLSLLLPPAGVLTRSLSQGLGFEHARSLSNPNIVKPNHTSAFNINSHSQL